MPLGPLESSAISLGVSGWQGGSDDANAYVLAIDRGYVLIGAQSPSEVAIMKDYQKYWAMSEAAELPVVRAPIVYATVEVGGDGGGATVLDVLQAHSIATGGAEPDLFCFKMAGSASGSAAAEQHKAIADGVKAAWDHRRGRLRRGVHRGARVGAQRRARHQGCVQPRRVVIGESGAATGRHGGRV